MANINQISPDGGTTIYDLEDSTARSGVNGLTPRVGIAEGKITTLQEQMLSVQDGLGGLGTASTKNSTSVVTQSTDLVESGAVKDIVGWGNKNLYADEQYIQFGSAYNLRTKTIPLTKPLGAGTYTFNLQTTGTADINIQIRYNGDTYHKVLSLPYTFTVNSGSKCDSIYIYISQDDYNGGKSATASKIQIEAGTVATAYEPYHIPLKDALTNKCDNSVIGTVEGANASKAWSVGEHFISGGQFKEVTQVIAVNEEINSGNTTNKPIADLLTKIGNLSYKMINTGTALNMVSTGINTKNQFFAVIILLSGDDSVSQILCGRRHTNGTFVTTDSTNVNIDENGILTVKGNAGSARYHIIYAQN